MVPVAWSPSRAALYIPQSALPHPDMTLAVVRMQNNKQQTYTGLTPHQRTPLKNCYIGGGQREKPSTFAQNSDNFVGLYLISPAITKESTSFVGQRRAVPARSKAKGISSQSRQLHLRTKCPLQAASSNYVVIVWMLFYKDIHIYICLPANDVIYAPYIYYIRYIYIYLYHVFICIILKYVYVFIYIL